jgi:DNA-binding response OmpR family regulator
MSRKQIVVVEDERDMAELISLRLKKEGYDVEVAHNGMDGLRLVQSSRPDLVLLDLMLPGLSGTEVAQKLRDDPRTREIPIIMVTAKAEDSDVVVGLHMGADDYVTKPFSMSVLLARISAVLRRGENHNGKTAISVGPINIDQERHQAEVDGEPVSLTLTEFRLLAALAAARGRVLSRNQLIDQAIGMDAVVTDRTIDVHLTSLRRKLGPARKFVKTVRGVGYRIAGSDDDE